MYDDVDAHITYDIINVLFRNVLTMAYMDH